MSMTPPSKSSDDPVDLDFTGHFEAIDLSADTMPALPTDGPAVPPELLIGVSALSSDHYYVNVARTREKRAVDPSATTVLVMEDDTTTRNILELLLTRDLGFKVRTASDVRSFVAAIQQGPLPDLLVLDIELPGKLSGFNILAKVRSHPAICNMPVIIFSSHSDPQHLHRGLSLGADAYLSKPAKASALADAIKAVLGG